MTLAEMRRKVSCKEFVQWAAFFTWRAAQQKQPKGGKQR